MASKFDEFASLVVERAESTTPKTGTTYGLNPEFDSAALTGFDRLAANFVEEKPATAEEIINVIKANGDDGNEESAISIFRNLIDSKILIPKSSEEETEVEGEPAAAELEKEPEVAVEDPAAAVQSVTAVDDVGEEEEEGSAVPPPEEDEADTFQQPEVKSRVADISPEEPEIEDDNDDTPASVLLKKEQQKQARMKDQARKLVNYIWAKRGKSPEEAAKYLEHLKAKGLA